MMLMMVIRLSIIKIIMRISIIQIQIRFESGSHEDKIIKHEDYHDDRDDDENGNDNHTSSNQIWERFSWRRRPIWRPWRNPCPCLLSYVSSLSWSLSSLISLSSLSTLSLLCPWLWDTFQPFYLKLQLVIAMIWQQFDNDTQVRRRRPHWRRWKLER